MNPDLLKHIAYGLLSGLSEILPVSSQAHMRLWDKLLGSQSVHGFPFLMIHLGILAALYTCNKSILMKMFQARRLSFIPKKKRKRPLDLFSLLDLRFWYTAMIPVIFALLFYGRISSLSIPMPLLSLFLFLNGFILYVPQFFPSSNKDSRTLTRAEGLFVGLGSGLGLIPGLSASAGVLSLGSIAGIDRKYALSVMQLLEIIWMSGLILYDIADIISAGFGVLSVQRVLVCFISACASYAAARLSVKLLRAFAGASGYYSFAFYCWGVAFFTFLLNLLA